MAENNSLQDNLTRLMKAQNLSMRELSLRAKLGETAVKSIIAGKSQDPRNSTIKNLAKALQCRVSDLIGEQSMAHSGGFREKESLSYISSGKKLYDPSLRERALTIVNEFIKNKNLKIESDIADKLIDKTERLLSKGETATDGMLELLYEDMVPPKNF